MDRLRALSVFVRVAERGSFSAAAADLGLSHGMAGAVVKEIEAGLGVELIRRTTRRMALTEEGLIYLARARRILEDYDDLEESLSTRGAAKGRLKVQAPVALSRLVLAPSLGPFLSAHPDLRLSLVSRDQLPDMVADDIDILLYVGALPDSALTVRTLGRFPLITVAAPAYLESRGAPETLADLDRHQLLDVTSATTGRPLPWQFHVDGRTILRPANARLAFENSEAAVAAALSGAGIVQNISYVLSDHLASGRLVEVLGQHRDPGSELHMVTRRYAVPPGRIRVFSDHVRKLARSLREAVPPVASGGKLQPDIT